MKPVPRMGRSGAPGRAGLRAVGPCALGTGNRIRGRTPRVVADPADIDNRRRRVEDLPLPEGNYGLPIIGETLDYLKNRTDFLRERYQRYGPVSKTHLFGKPAIIIHGADILEKMPFEEHESLNAELNYAMKLLVGDKTMFTATGDDHIFQRKMIAPEFSATAVTRYIPSMQKVAQKYLSDLASGRVTTFLGMARQYTFSVMTEAAMGLTFPFGGLEKQDFIDLLVDWVNGMYEVLTINAPFTPFGRAMRAKERLLAAIDKAVDDMLAMGEECKTGFSKMLTASDPIRGKMSREQINNNILSILFAGYDTTASVLSMILLKLANYPEVWKMVCKEQDEIVATFGTEMNKESVAAMEYTQAVITEGLRLEHPLPAVSFSSDKTLEVNGFQIPKGTTILFCCGFAMRYLDDRWPGDEKFCPHRHLTDVGKEPRTNLVFGVGPHMCLGKHLAVEEATILVGQMARDYDFSLINPNPKVKDLPLPHPEDLLPMKLVKRTKQ